MLHKGIKEEEKRGADARNRKRDWGAKTRAICKCQLKIW